VGDQVARKRMIDPGIWQSQDFGRLSELAKLLFIGLFTQADDEGRGIGNPVYLKSSIFPYKESLRSADVEKALSEISSNMSVFFYSCNGNQYYQLTNWDKWQKIDKPSQSKIPEFQEENMQIETFGNNSTNVRRVLDESSSLIEKNKNRKEIEEKKKEKEFVAPTLEEIEKYVNEKKLNVDAKKFFNYFTEGNWVDSKGNKVKNWKQKLLTWSSYQPGSNNSNTKNNSNVMQAFKDDPTGQYADLESFYLN